MLPNGYWEIVTKEEKDETCTDIKRSIWTNYTDRMWPLKCSVHDCSNEATIVAAIRRCNADIRGIIPVCRSCAKRVDLFKLKWVPVTPYEQIAVLPKG